MLLAGLRMLDDLSALIGQLRRIQTEAVAVTPRQVQAQACEGHACADRIAPGAPFANDMRGCLVAPARAPACQRLAAPRHLDHAASLSFMTDGHRRSQ